MLFNLKREYSIIDNNSFELVWEYTLFDSLFTDARGECHRLKNNNTLIATGKSNNFLEINENNEIVWHVVTSSFNGSNTVYRIFKIDNLYPSSFMIEFDNYKGTIDYPYIKINDNNILSFKLINNGWLDDQYEININDYN